MLGRARSHRGAVVLCVAALFGPPAPGLAFTEDGVECMGKAGDGKARLACAEAELKAQNRMLAASLQRLKSTLDERGAELLARSQQAWETYRDAHCALMVDRLRKDADAQRIERILCLANVTEARAQDIDEYQTVP